MGETAISDDALGLIESLRGADDWRARRRAALRLVHHRNGEALQALIDALGDRDPQVRHAAVVALGDFGEPAAVDVLCRPRLLEDAAPEIRWATVRALGLLGDLSIVNVLSSALEDPEWVVRNQALLVITDFIRTIPEVVDGEQVKHLIRLLTIADAEVHDLVVDALSRRSTRGLDEMVEAMKLKSRVVRAGVAEALGLSQDPRAVAALVDATRDPVGSVRREAARGLGRLLDPSAVEALIVVLGDADVTAAKAAVEALVAIGVPAVVSLCTALEHSISKLHRRNVILTLGGIGDRRAVVPILNNLSSTYYVVRQSAITALSSFGEDVVDDLVEMVQVSEVPIGDLVREATGDKALRLRLRAVRALGEIKNAAAVRPLRTLMREDSRELVATTQIALSKIGLAAWARYGAVITLGNIAHPKSVPAMVRALKDHSEYVRREAARALAKVPDPTAILPLIEALEVDDDHTVRREAAATLRLLGEQSPVVAHAFRQALGDSSWEVRAEAARALGRIDDAQSVGPLLGALQDSSYTVTTSAEHALANLGEMALPQLLRAAGGADSPRLRPALRSVAEYLGEDVDRVEGLADQTLEERQAALETMARGE